MSTSTTFKLLLIEPCDDLRSVMTVLLELAGCEVRSTSSSLVALTIAASFQPDMVLTELAGVGRIGIAEQLKSIPEMRNVHIVALTSLYWKGIEADAARAGFAQYLLKPATFDSLVQVLATLATIRGKKLHMANFTKASESVRY